MPLTSTTSGGPESPTAARAASASVNDPPRMRHLQNEPGWTTVTISCLL